MFNVRTMSAVERKALELAFRLNDPEQATVDVKNAYEQVICEKWSSVPFKGADGKVRKFNWLGKDAEDLGFPKIESDKSAREVAMMLENQLRYQKSKRRAVAGGFIADASIFADTTTGDEALPTNFALAMVRRAYALMHVEDWSVRQPMHAPTGYVWFIDFLRENDGSNLLSANYGAFKTAEGAVPKKGKIKLQRALVTADKQLMGTTFTLEASEDAMAQLGLNIEQELISEFTQEFVRNRFEEHLNAILNGALTATATGSSLPTPWSQAGQTAAGIPAQGGNAASEWKQMIYNALIDADATYVAANRRPANGIVAGLTLASRLQKANQATDSTNVTDNLDNDLGINNYGHFAGRFHIWATDLLPPTQGFLYRRNPDTLRAGHVYAPYVPLQVMPATYAGYDATTGNFQNTDEYTRNIRERSAQIVTKPYAFVPLVAS